MNAKKLAYLEALIQCFGNIGQACNIVGMHRQTHYDWLKNDAEFKEAFEKITPEDYLESKKDFIESKLISLINANNPAAIIFACKTLLKDRGYVEKQEIDIRTMPINWHEELTLTEEQQAEFLNEIDSETKHRLPEPNRQKNK